jgi:shikimate dehydrogenase
MSDEKQALITGATRLVAIIGDPVAQVKSPQLLNPLMARAGHNAIVVPVHIPAAQFDAAMHGLTRLANIAGIIVTLPFKERAMVFAQVVHEAARQIGAVNTMRREPDGSWSADNFDGAGCLKAIAAGGGSVAGRSVLLIGAGGAGRAIAVSLARAGAKSIAIRDLDTTRSTALAHHLATHFPDIPVTAAIAPASSYEVIINASPVGMRPGDGLPVPVDRLDAATFVMDIVAYSGTTPLLDLARQAGCKTNVAAAMVMGQAELMLDFIGLYRPA